MRKDFREQILMVKDQPQFPMVLIGNKADLEPNQRHVTFEEGQEQAKKWGCSFFETSAKTRQNIEECFSQLVRDMLKYAAGKSAPTTGLAGEKKKKMSLFKSESFRNMKKSASNLGNKCVVM